MAVLRRILATWQPCSISRARTEPRHRCSQAERARLLIALARSGLEDQLQILDFTELVIDREQGLDHVLDLARHAVQLLKRHAFQLASDLLVETEDGAEAAGRREPRVDLVV